MNNKNTLKMRVPGAKQAIENMKYEIASEFGVNLGPDATSRANGTVGGEITKRLVSIGDMLGIKVIDHVIIGSEKYYSFLENGDI